MKTGPGLSTSALRHGLIGIIAGASLASVAAAQSSPSAFTSATRYDAMRRAVGTIEPDPDGSGPLAFAAVRNTYDASGRLVKVETGELVDWQSESTAPASWAGFTIFLTKDIGYDAMDRKTRETISANGSAYSVTQYSYDAAGRISCTATRMNPSAFAALPASACTVGTQGSFGPDRITHNVYDDSGKVLKVQRAYGTTLQQDYTTYTYTQNGNPATVTDANGNTSLTTYDGHDRHVQLNFPAKTSPGVWSSNDYEQYAYDANGNRTSIRKRDSQLIYFSFDALDRQIVKDVPGTSGDVYTSYTYDANGMHVLERFASSTGPVATDDYLDGFNRLTSRTNGMSGTARTMSYLYDEGSNRTRMTFPDGVYFTYEYDGRDRMTAIRQSGTTAIASLSYDVQGRRKGLSGGVSTTYAYDPVGRLATLNHNLAGTAHDVSYSSTTSSPTNSSYNPAHQLLKQTRNNTAYAWTSAVVVNRAYAANGLNQYTTVGSASPTYDANGNLFTDGSSTYNYDVENRLVSVTGATNGTLSYDPAGRLIQTSGSAVISFLYDGAHLAAEYDVSGNVLRRYVHGVDFDEPLAWYEGSGLGNRRHLRADRMGSVIAVTDASGNAITINTYDEYGVRAATNIGRFQFTGQMYLPELNLYYYKARMYSPAWGRFLQVDPVGYSDDMNLYAYVGGDPIGKSDPTGLKAYDCTGGSGPNCNLSARLKTGDTIKIGDTTFTFTSVVGNTASYTASTPTMCGAPQTLTFNSSNGAYMSAPETPQSSGSASGATAFVANSAAIGTSVLEHAPAMNVGNNGKIYKASGPGRFSGNGSVKVINSAKAAKAGTHALAGVAFLADSYSYGKGEISGKKYSVNTAVTLVGVFGGPVGAGIAIGYFVGDSVGGEEAGMSSGGSISFGPTVFDFAVRR
jgi:RHS repeat-associated protein